MSEEKQPVDDKPGPEQPPPLDEATVQFLLSEYSVLKDLFADSASAGRSLFNFYLTLLSALIGGIVLLVQLGSSIQFNAGIVVGLLAFGSLLGVVYQAALVGIYADNTRYARAIDDLRLYLAERLPDATPPLYHFPVKAMPAEAEVGAIEKIENRMWWMNPVSTFSLVVNVITSANLSVLVLIALRGSGLLGIRPIQSMLAVVVVFGVSYLLQQVYGQVRFRQQVRAYTRKVA